MFTALRTFIASERLRHAAIAIGLAVLVGVTTILRPIDISVWSLQSKMFERQASGDIVFVEVDRSSGTTARDSINGKLATALRNIDRSGADQIYIDLPLERSDSTADDEALHNELYRLSGKVVLTTILHPEFEGNERTAKTAPYFSSGLQKISGDYRTDFLSFVWTIDATHSSAGETLPSLWRVVASDQSMPLATRDATAIEVDYSISPNTIPHFALSDFLDLTQPSVPALTGRSVIIGLSTSRSEGVKFPGEGAIPSSYVHLLAAETARNGHGQFWDWRWGVAIFSTLLLCCITFSSGLRSRRILYGMWSVAIVALVVGTAWFAARAMFAETLSIALMFGSLRGVANFKRRHLFIEPRSQLPNFAALRRDLSGEINYQEMIVIAKVARLDSIFATLTQAEQGIYLRQVASRLALGDAGASVYYDGGKYFALPLLRADYGDIQTHLEGLRAVASQSVYVGDRSLDVLLTIGVDDTPAKSGNSRLSSAIAAADQAREAYRPIFIVSEMSADVEEWDYSLQARLETALSEDRIAIKLQPQIDLKSGKIIGAESLARWVDKEHGDVAPSRFIIQCERAGRLDELTRRILQKSLNASEALNRQGLRPNVSINVSAIQFVDHRIADLFETELLSRPIDPKTLTIEVTETARIEDMDAARSAIERIKGLGVKFSIDDFGVASANLETLFELPFDEIKIDRLFVEPLLRSSVARAIVFNVVRMAKDAGMISVAEGIEDRETLTLLRDSGCDTGQGFFISRPLPIAGFAKLMILQRDSCMLPRKFG